MHHGPKAEIARLACLIALSLGLASPVLAQLQGARIVGTTFDPQRAGIPDVTVTVTDVATNVVRTAATDREGSRPRRHGSGRNSRKVQGSRFKVQGSRFMVHGSWFKVQGSRSGTVEP